MYCIYYFMHIYMKTYTCSRLLRRVYAIFTHTCFMPLCVLCSIKIANAKELHSNINKKKKKSIKRHPGIAKWNASVYIIFKKVEFGVFFCFLIKPVNKNRINSEKWALNVSYILSIPRPTKTLDLSSKSTILCTYIYCRYIHTDKLLFCFKIIFYWVTVKLKFIWVRNNIKDSQSLTFGTKAVYCSCN